MSRFGRLPALIIAGPLLTLSLSGCNSSSSGTASTGSTEASATSMESLPKATGPVTSTSSLSARGIQGLASTGLVLSSAATSSFNGTSSTGLCETAKIVKTVYTEAANPDSILCYMGAMEQNSVIPSGVDDGEWHYLKLTNLPDAGGTNEEPVVKVRITKNSSGAITDFKMHSCFNGSTASPEQSEYISQVFASSGVTVTAKYLGSESGQSYGSSVTATGSTNSSGGWSEKSVSALSFHSDGGSNSYNYGAEITQFADYLAVSAYQKGSFSSGSDSDTFSNAYYSQAQIIGDDAMNTLALGDGSAKYAISASGTAGGGWSHSDSGVESWDGDTSQALGDSTLGDYYTNVNAQSVATVPSSVQTISFSSDEAWDCTLPSGESWVDADFSAGDSGINTAMQSCDTQFGLGRAWIDCFATY